MEFRIPVEIADPPFRIGVSNRGVVLGSCFAEHVGGWLRAGKMPVCVNPFGVLYNPASIAQAWLRLEAGPAFADDELVEHNGLWHSFLHHQIIHAVQKIRKSQVEL